MNLENDLNSNEPVKNVTGKIMLLAKIFKTILFVYGLLKNIFIIYLFYLVVKFGFIF